MRSSLAHWWCVPKSVCDLIDDYRIEYSLLSLVQIWIFHFERCQQFWRQRSEEKNEWNIAASTRARLLIEWQQCKQLSSVRIEEKEKNYYRMSNLSGYQNISAPYCFIHIEHITKHNSHIYLRHPAQRRAQWWYSRWCGVSERKVKKFHFQARVTKSFNTGYESETNWVDSRRRFIFCFMIFSSLVACLPLVWGPRCCSPSSWTRY